MMADAIEWFITTFGVGAVAMVLIVIFVVLTYPGASND